jgi:hypothetical protein
MGNQFSTVSKWTELWSATDFLMDEHGTPIKIHQRLLAFYGENTVYMSTVHCWVSKSTAQWQKLGPEWPATVWYREKVKFIQENWQISGRSIAEKSNTGLPCVSEITRSSGYKKGSAQWVSCPITSELKTDRKVVQPWLLTCYEC